MLFSNVREDEFEYVKEFEKNYVVYKEVKLKTVDVDVRIVVLFILM